MNKSLIVHGSWFLAVVAAFTLGFTLSNSRNNVNSADNGQRVTLAQDAGAAEAGASVPGGTSKKSGKEDAEKGPAGWANSTRPLSDVEIEDLGRQFKNPLDPIGRRMAFARMLEGLTVENAKLIREQIAHLDSNSAEFREFHYAWGAIGGQDAVLNGAETNQRDMAATLAGWASADPRAAIDWFQSLEKSDKFNPNDLKIGMVHGLANIDTSVATDYAFSQAKSGDKQAEQMLGIITEKVLQSGSVTAAADWATNLPSEGGLRSSAMDRVAHDYVAKDPTSAAAWAEQFVNEPGSARVIEEVGDEWAERDPAASVAWLETLDSGDGKSAGLNSALGEWARRDPTAASQYLIDMPTSPERDSAISGFASRVAWEDPASAITWAEEIADPGTRTKTLVQAGQALYRRDSEAAKIWAESSGLSPEAQQKVLNPPRRGR